MPQYLTNEKLTSVQVMAWCRQVITWAEADPDLYPYMMSLGNNELINWIVM